ncbi:MAG: FMN-binding protein [Spirochaetales bacterium]|nr:MAG: FMN-binding protein [Spirochaetales bacterium]
MNKEGTTYTIVFVFIVSFVFVFLLALTNQVTVAQVKLNQELARQSAVLSAMGIAASTPQEIQDAFTGVAGDETAGLYAATVDGEVVFASQFSGPGLWGTITCILAVTSDLKKIVGLQIVSDNETPGLGGRINESWFKDQFRGEAILDTPFVVTPMDGDGDPVKSNGILDAVTGATRTSDSMEAIVNNVIRSLREPQIRQTLNVLASQGGKS